MCLQEGFGRVKEFAAVHEDIPRCMSEAGLHGMILNRSALWGSTPLFSRVQIPPCAQTARVASWYGTAGNGKRCVKHNGFLSTTVSLLKSKYSADPVGGRIPRIKGTGQKTLPACICDR